MSLFDRLFARAPKLPDPVHDPLGGDAAMRRALEGLKVGEWREADELLAGAKKGDRRGARAGHIALAAEGWPKWIEEWHAARKERAEPWLIRGAIRMGQAWAVRGSGRADEVDEDAWPVFHERLREAESDLLEASRRDGSDATPLAYLLASGAALDMGVPDLLQRFDEARKRDPEGWLAPWQALNALSEKWSGSHDVMFALARDVSANEVEGSQLHALVAEAHLHRWQYFSMDDPPDPKGQARYFDDDNVQRELARAWERGPGSRHFKPGPFGNSQVALFAFAFSLGEDKDLARAAFEKLNNRLTMTPWGHLGDPMEVFVEFRNAALR